MVHLTHLGRRGSTASANERAGQGVDLEAQRSVESNTSQNRRLRPHVQITEPSSESLAPHVPDSAYLEAPNSPVMKKRDRSDSMVSRASSYKSMRRRGRAETTNNVAYSAEEMGITTGWSVGQEPGIDTSASTPPYRKGSIGEADVYGEKYHQTCEITCVDYSLDQIQQVTLDNDNLEEHLESPVPDWSQVRWINVNGLSWDVIRVLGNYRNLHPLAIEDLMNTRSRTKADWYPDHTFLVLPLQKLVNLEDEDDSDSSSDEEDNAASSAKGNSVITEKDDPHDDGDDDPVHHMNEQERRNKEEKHRKKKKGAINALISDIFKSKKDQREGRKKDRRDKLTPANSFNKAPKVKAPWVPKHVRSLQRYHAGPNQDRTSYMERNAALSTKGLGVSVEQVSIFLCSDNTLISFFEYSAQDVEVPLLRRLQTTGTILRQSCDASMLMQSILDAIIDLAIPVTAAYQDTIGDLELEVLTDPDIHESKSLYILTCEISILRNAIAPVAQLMSALKDHKSTSTAATVIPPSRSATPASAEIQQIMNGTHTPVHHAPLHHTHSHNSHHHHKVVFPNGKPLHRPTPGRPTPVASTKSFTTINTGVTISPLTITYLGDIEDHALLIRDSYDQMRRSADNLVDLIFNTVSAYQNESMKQLTVITCFFLPLTFLTGYFGMNFEGFNAVKNNSDTYFWSIAVPVCMVVFMILLRDVWTRFFVKWANKALIVRGRKRRLKK